VEHWRMVRASLHSVRRRTIRKRFGGSVYGLEPRTKEDIRRAKQKDSRFLTFATHGRRFQSDHAPRVREGVGCSFNFTIFVPTPQNRTYAWRPHRRRLKVDVGRNTDVPVDQIVRNSREPVT
jgi:hypothetical protein